jgi:hypothetical protein
MKTITTHIIGSKPTPGSHPGEERIEIVVPFTRAELTQAALDQADQLIAKEDFEIRVIAVQIVPVPLPIDRPPVSSDHWKAAIGGLLCRAPARGEIYLVRDAADVWARFLKPRSVIVIASRKRPWRTQEERLARALRRYGHEVLLIYPR